MVDMNDTPQVTDDPAAEFAPEEIATFASYRQNFDGLALRFQGPGAEASRVLEVTA